MHLEWGHAGWRDAGRQADVVVVVDVLRFSTAVAVAAAAGVDVYPVRSGDTYAPKIAERLGARLAEERLAWFAGLAPGERVVLPAAPGAELCLDAAAAGATVVAGCLRNATAVGAWLAARQRRVVVVAAGDRWRDGADRWTVEDLLGAGAIFAALPEDSLSAEAQVAAAAFRATRDRIAQILRLCTSGRTDPDAGLAADVDASPVVPVLVDGRFQKA